MKKLYKDLSGNRYGEIEVISRNQGSPHGGSWLCLCHRCGKYKSIGYGDLIRKRYTQCGCNRHGHWKNRRSSPMHNSWTGMHQRCSNPKNPKFRDYGARGISVCDRWNDFQIFLGDMGERPSPKHSLGRIDNSIGYSPENCRWETASQQARNTRRNKVLEFNGVRNPLVKWCEIYGLKYSIIQQRIVAGWTFEEAFILGHRENGRAR